MSGRPYYKRFPSDFITGCMKLSLEEKGAYSMVVDLIFDEGGAIENDPQWIARVCGCSTRKWTQVLSALISKDKLFIEPDGRIHAKGAKKRLQIEVEEARKFAENGSKGGQKRAENRRVFNENNDLAEKGLPENLSIPIPVPIPILDSVDSDSKESTNQPPTDSVPAPARKIARLHMDSPRSEWVALALSVDPTATVRKEDPQHRANPGVMMPQDEVYLGPDGYRRGFYFAARKLTQAARQPERWTCDWTVLARWMIEGYDINEDIAPLVSAMAAEKTYPKDNLNSLNFFSKKLHQLTPFAKRESEKPSPLDFVLRRVVNN